MKRVNPSKITFASLEDLGKFLFRELQRLTATINENSELSQVVLAEEPTRPAIGKLAYADGENWNPGDGEGTYEYTSTGWVKLGNSSISEEIVVNGISGICEYSISRGRRSGSFTFQTAQKLSATAVKSPVFIQQMCGDSDEEENVQLVCSGRILSPKKIQVRWIAIGGIASGNKRFNYFIPLKE